MLPGVDAIRHAVALGFGNEPLFVKCLVIVVQPKLLGGATPPLLIAELLLFSQTIHHPSMASFPIFLLGNTASRCVRRDFFATHGQRRMLGVIGCLIFFLLFSAP